MCFHASIAFFAPAAVYSQDVSRSVEIEDLGFSLPVNAGARPAGMAGAYVAAGYDIHSLIYNPAGLAQIKRIEISLGLQQERTDISNVFFGNPTGVDSRNGGIEAVGVAYPFPTYRGSLVAAFGVYRIYSSFFNIHHSGRNDRTETFDNYLLQQTGSLYSYNLGFGVDLSPTLSGGVSIFLIDGAVDVLTQFDFTEIGSVPKKSIFELDDASVDVDGFGGRVGMQFFVHENLSGGISFATPVWMQLEGDGLTERTTHLDNSVDSFEEAFGIIKDQYLMPFRVDVGMALDYKSLLFAAEFGYADWTETAINRKRLRSSYTLETMFREVFDYRLGTEISVPRLPVLLRAGYAYRPYALKYLQSDRIDNNNNGLVKATVDHERKQFTLGLGGVIGTVLTVDAAFVHTRGERSIDTMNDKRSSSRFSVSVCYRL